MKAINRFKLTGIALANTKHSSDHSVATRSLRRRDSEQDGLDRHMMTAIAIYLGLVLVMSLVCFVAYCLDTRRAANGGRQIPEQTLHILALLGGWPVAVAGTTPLQAQDKEIVFPDRLLVPRRVARRNIRNSGVCVLWKPTAKVTNQG